MQEMDFENFTSKILGIRSRCPSSLHDITMDYMDRHRIQSDWAGLARDRLDRHGNARVRHSRKMHRAELLYLSSPPLLSPIYPFLLSGPMYVYIHVHGLKSITSL
jgi:hypothetical protein